MAAKKDGARPRGRPTLCTPEITAAIAALVEEGVAFKTACETQALSEQDGYNWLKWGEEGREPYAAFFLALTCGRAWGEVALHRKVVKGGPGSGMVAWMLERRFREHYGPARADAEKTEVKIIIEGGLPKRPQ